MKLNLLLVSHIQNRLIFLLERIEALVCVRLLLRLAGPVAKHFIPQTHRDFLLQLKKTIFFQTPEGVISLKCNARTIKQNPSLPLPARQLTPSEDRKSVV